MNRHPRIRKTLKWGGAALSVMLLLVWVGSGWRSVGWSSRGGAAIYVTTGWVAIGHGARGHLDDPKPGWFIASGIREFYWWFRWEQWRTVWTLYVPLWFPAGLALVTSALAWRLDTLARRRARVGYCPKCSYNLTGLPPTAPCPECGAAPI